MDHEKEALEVSSLISTLTEKDTSETYRALQRLEQLSDETGLLYAYRDRFAAMIGDSHYIIRVRGFRLFCRQAKWDTDQFLDEHIDDALCILKDEKPTAVRQALTAIQEVVRYKPDLRETVKRAVSNIDYFRYKDTMHGLIAKDMKEVLALIDSYM